eukprot:CAMPEP_0194028994 /NCGR_PEP_ID=MMETSP0009_2-20130614/2856_1 /TAXON_ID=210454 /ORGANISM="Grammatophora oceanica, Strain CCMP 410" /LENGTH=525 /DNA_ID=CAMNT_0038668555 /DNA_START=24 /DNA_END=1601 /DNA_ORIENTATION=-
MKVASIFLLLASTSIYAANDDRFNYRGTEGNNYGPEDWGSVTCDDPNNCLGWPDSWELSMGWNLAETSCQHCPANTNKQCGGSHHQSPIDLLRNKAINGSSTFNECIDVHWMKYEDSSCSWDHISDQGGFTIEPHTLKITQPTEIVADGSIRLSCPSEGGRRWGKIDFSKGFSQWWFLSHIDFKVPSEHSQEGKFYSGEIQMAHFYSVTGDEANVDNEMAHVSIFIQEYDNVPPYPWLDRAICQWRKTEEEQRAACGLPSVDPYPGCFPYSRDENNVTAISRNSNARNLRTADSKNSKNTNSNPEDKKSALEFMQGQPLRVEIEPDNFAEHSMTDEEWAAWAEAYSESDNKRFEAWNNGERRELLEWDHRSFHNYQPLIDVKTEYYFRYSGTQTVPPCYGRFDQSIPTLGGRGFTNHWRVMKDPIPVHSRQITELHRLLRERINPASSQTRTACAKETAGKVDETTGRINVARPLQYTSHSHFKVFCECQDWRSKWPEDRKWCASGNQNQRLYDNPYNHEWKEGF